MNTDNKDRAFTKEQCMAQLDALDADVYEGTSEFAVETHQHACETVATTEHYLEVTFDNGPFNGKVRIPWYMLDALDVKKPDEVRCFYDAMNDLLSHSMMKHKQGATATAQERRDRDDC